MEIRNSTTHRVEHIFSAALREFDHGELRVEIKYCPAGTKRVASGTYYRWTRTAPDGKLIRLRVNRTNRYPVSVPFKTSEYYTKKDSRGREVIYQKFRIEKLKTPEHLLLAVFLHEFSHYLDHIEGRNGRYKQTKADRFAIEKLTELRIL